MFFFLHIKWIEKKEVNFVCVVDESKWNDSLNSNVYIVCLGKTHHCGSVLFLSIFTPCM